MKILTFDAHIELQVPDDCKKFDDDNMPGHFLMDGVPCEIGLSLERMRPCDNGSSWTADVHPDIDVFGDSINGRLDYTLDGETSTDWRGPEIDPLCQRIFPNKRYDVHLSDDAPSIFATGEKLKDGRKRWEKEVRSFFSSALSEGKLSAATKNGWDSLTDKPCTSSVVVRYFGSEGHITKWDSVLAYFGHTYHKFSVAAGV